MPVITVVLFADFTALDVFGPVDVLGRLGPDYRFDYVSPAGGAVLGSGGTRVETRALGPGETPEILLVPGGWGTRLLVSDSRFLEILRGLADRAQLVLTVCTGSGLLAKTGALGGRRATSNKLAWEWVTAQDPSVQWVRHARWVVDGKFRTSAGITAGIDMALGFGSEVLGIEAARRIATTMEYRWNPDPEDDPFA